MDAYLNEPIVVRPVYDVPGCDEPYWLSFGRDSQYAYERLLQARYTGKSRWWNKEATS